MNPPASNAIRAPCPQCGYDLRSVAGDICPSCGRRVARLEGVLVPTVHWPGLLRSLAIRTLIALPLSFGLVCVSVWASSILGSAKIQATPAIILGVVFGYGFGFGLAGRANRVSALVFIIVALTITAIVAAAIIAVLLAFPPMLNSAGSKRFWFAAGAFGGTTIMCALIALRYESRSTVLLR